ncbi:MAG: ABC transporter permease [Eubacterium sp.]|nr:ABC transporter permease [Eubacterium sp.]
MADTDIRQEALNDISAQDEILTASRSLRYRGRLRQIPIYLGKNFRMFIFQNDWKVIPMAAIISFIVVFVIKGHFNIDMEGTLKGGLALTCVCLWNGFFNSIQVVCRERNIVKREHRSGMHISSYIIAHMIYQLFLCVLQTITIMAVLLYRKLQMPSSGVITNSFLLDFFITLLLITYCADMLSLLISSIVHSTTSAMTIMPLILMIQLIFSGGIFALPKGVDGVKDLMLSSHGMAAICAEAEYNELPSITGWKMLKKVAAREDADERVKTFVKEAEASGQDKMINKKMAESNTREAFNSTKTNITIRWWVLVIFSFVFALAAIIALERIDKDKR